jgi:hypothetical protein
MTGAFLIMTFLISLNRLILEDFSMRQIDPSERVQPISQNEENHPSTIATGGQTDKQDSQTDTHLS